MRFGRQNSPGRTRVFCHADRIQARAIRRCGELLKQFDGRQENAKQKGGGDRLFPTRSEAAADAGMSQRQVKTAVRVANVPAESDGGVTFAPTLRIRPSR